MVMIDMDSFKEFNDRWGHPAGDQRLKEAADLLRTNLRNPDVVVRYGGEEFALILPNTSKSNALVLAERLRAAAEESAGEPFKPGKVAPGYTFSMGVATYPEDGLAMPELIFAADQAELQAKKMGKNRICSFTGKITSLASSEISGQTNPRPIIEKEPDEPD
jgi:diguanylate cyclase (GGDEF)-like protein